MLTITFIPDFYVEIRRNFFYKKGFVKKKDVSPSTWELIEPGGLIINNVI
jgi:hypothetical protein